MNDIYCPKCKSKNVTRGGLTAARRLENHDTRSPHIVPNNCHDCGFSWPVDGQEL